MRFLERAIFLVSLVLMASMFLVQRAEREMYQIAFEDTRNSLEGLQRTVGAVLPAYICKKRGAR